VREDDHLLLLGRQAVERGLEPLELFRACDK
jgi:hypothetical protein